MEINYTSATRMMGGFPKIRKCGAISPCGENSPFVWKDSQNNGKETLMRLELSDPSHGTDPNQQTVALIRNYETGEIVSRLGIGCYYYSLYQEQGTVYILGTVSSPGKLCGEEIRIFSSRDLKNWDERSLLKNPGWQYFNTSLTKGPNGYILLLEANKPAEYVGAHPFTLFFASSPDLVNWTFMSYDKGFSKERYMGGPFLKYSRGWYYLLSVTEFPCQRYTNYIYRTKDFDTWEVGFYNPILMPSDEDRIISPHAHDLSDELIEDIRTGFISSNSDIDMCEYQGKTIITYNVGNQLGFYYLAEAEYDGPIDEFFEAYFR
ncbi:MAG: hypothetical protein PUE85_06940 [Firmicutes bacterium]|nr:hypothetical protein [Bacillota bacterium]